MSKAPGGAGQRDADREHDTARHQPQPHRTLNGRSHDLVNGHGVPPSCQRFTLQRHVPTSAGGCDSILHHCEGHDRGERCHDEDRARANGHNSIIRSGLADFALRAPKGNRFGGWFAIEFGPAKEQPMNIREVMTPNPQCVSPGDSIQNAARIMRDCDTGAVPVVDNGRPVGIVTDRDIVVRAVAEDKQLNRPVRDIVSADVIYVTPEMSTHEAVDLMSEHQVRRLPVVENNRLVGIVSLGDLAVKEAKDRRIGDALEHISEGVKETGYK